jgi:two-component system sensor histidine kinase/response regulator
MMIDDLMPPRGANALALGDQDFALRDAPMRALLDSETRYRRLFEAAQDGILLINAESGQIEDANPYLTKMLGYSHDELMGKKLWDVGAFADIDKSTGMFERLQAEGYVRYSDLPLRTRGGALISVEFVSNAYDCAGVRVIQCNIRNITEQRLAEDQVRKLSLVVEQSPVAIVIANLAGDIEYVNAALLRNSGYRQGELIGRPARTLQSAAMSPLTFADISASIGQGEIWRGEFRSQRKDGSEYDESAIVAPIRRANGTTSHCVTISEDITERKRDALELDRHRHALEALVDTRTQELAVAKLAAEAANIAKSAFLTNMSHEIRTPLSAIMGFTYLIRRTQVTAKQAAWLSQLDVAGKHLLELINAILDLSKIEAGKLALEFTQVNAAGIAGSVVSILSERALAKHLKLVVDTHPLPQGLVGDASRLQQALLNYAGNAVKFTQAGSVTVRTLCVEETADTALLRFEVHDTGMGIAPEALERLFIPFEQVDSSITRQYGGTGLGLAIVRQLAHLMGGEAGARSTVGLGSTFWFTARLRKECRPEAARHHFKAESPEAALLRDHAGARVLLVDDDIVNREFTLEILHTVFDKVDIAKEGNEAVRMAGQCAYGLILMDMQMPGLGGLEAARQIRMLPGGSDSVIVALTANAFAEDKAACFEAGMDDFHSKPVKVETLFETVLKGLRQHRHRSLPTHVGRDWSRG